MQEKILRARNKYILGASHYPLDYPEHLWSVPLMKNLEYMEEMQESNKNRD